MVESPAFFDRVTCLPPKNASDPWGGPGSRWLTIVIWQVSYAQYLLACQKSQRSTPYNLVKSCLPWKWVFRRRHLGRRVTAVTCLRWPTVSKLRCIGSDNGLSPGRRWAIIWPSAEILLIGPLGINYSEISIASNTFSSHLKMHLKMSSAKWRLFRFGLNELNKQCQREVGRSVTRWPWFNVKMLSCQCRGSHCGDQTT